MAHLVHSFSLLVSGVSTVFVISLSLRASTLQSACGTMSRVTFTVNGRPYWVGAETDAETSLNAFLRYKLNLRGTKAMCHEGGCGACIVSALVPHPVTGELQCFAVNSCLVLVFSCHGWKVRTVEGIGNRQHGYHPIQSRLNHFYGSQCGYCSPGWIMSMYSLLDKNLTMAELEKSFGSNTCRCTGYRPILDTMKSFAVDASPDLFQRVKDIEDLHSISTCTKTGQLCTKSCADYDEEHDWCVIGAEVKSKLEDVLEINFPKHKFFMVTRVADIFSILDKYRTDDYMLLAGDTGKGVFNFTSKYPMIIIHIQNVSELKRYEIDQNLELGGGMTLEDTRAVCQDISNSQQEFAYLAQFAKHIELIAHLPVRHLGTLAGNLMVKHKMPSFQSDVFLLFETVGAYLTIKGAFNKEYQVSLTSFLKTDMNGKIIYNLRLPPLSRSYKLKTYKIMPRNQNAHAIVNAGFMVELNPKNIVLKASIVYGGISAKFVHATKTEQFLKGKYLFTNEILQGALKILAAEVNPEVILPAPSPASRKKLALGLFYKFVLSICPANLVSPRLRSGGKLIERPLSRGTQDFQTDSTKYPVSQSVPKLEGLIQCSGEALYANDMPSLPGEVFGAFVLSTVHSGTVDTIDASSVLKINGVHAVYTAKDIPGKNSFTRPGILIENADEEILASDKILYHGQPIAIVVCDSEALAAKVAKLVKVLYKNVSTKPPVLTIKEAKKDANRVSPSFTLEPKGRGTDVKKIIKGTYNIHSQYHYSMEPQTCLVVPVDNGLEVYSSTQWLSLTQIVIADSLNIPESSVQVKLRRVGGGFGAKISRSCQTATACALVAKLMNLPCRFILPMQTNMASIGGRLPVLAEYEVGVNDDGKIQYLELTCYEDQGCSINEQIILYITLNGIKNCYNPDYWHIKLNNVLTDLPSNTACRSPGNCDGIAMAEHLMEHIAFVLQKDSMSVKIANMRTEDNPLPQLLENFKKECDYENRRKSALQSNQANRWNKTFIEIIPMIFPVAYLGNFTAMVSIYQGDGTVTVSTGGVEMGQGLNTKAAQVCAYSLGIPLETVSVIPSYSSVAANNGCSGGSISSESVCYSIIKACATLKSRLQPIKDQLNNPSWKELIAKAGVAQIDLMASYMMTDKEAELPAYNVFGITILEVEVDCLTGQYNIKRVDLLEDTGLSINSRIDVGQVEGAFVMGLGYWTSEQLINDPSTGKLATDRSWEYKVPLALDIPADFRVKLRYNSRNAVGVLGSKAVAECPLCMAVVITHALRKCITDSRKESGYDVSKWLDIDTPYNMENILTALDVDIREFVLSTL